MANCGFCKLLIYRMMSSSGLIVLIVLHLCLTKGVVGKFGITTVNLRSVYVHYACIVITVAIIPIL